MKLNDNLNTQILKPWQRRGLIVIGAILGGLAVHGLLHWYGRRNQRACQNAAVPPRT